MEFIFELLFQFFGEFLLQIIFEVLGEVGLHSVREPFKKTPNPWFAGIGYILFGSIAGAISLWIFPHLFILSHSAQIAGLAITPFLSGAAMVAIGAWRRSRDQEIIRLDKFAYGYLFALSMAFIRYSFGQ